MIEYKFKIGDKVHIKGLEDGPNMIIVLLEESFSIPNIPYYKVIWFDVHQCLQNNSFPECLLGA